MELRKPYHGEISNDDKALIAPHLTVTTETAPGGTAP